MLADANLRYVWRELLYVKTFTIEVVVVIISFVAREGNEALSTCSSNGQGCDNAPSRHINKQHNACWNLKFIMMSSG
jgi:hypothetical protein